MSVSCHIHAKSVYVCLCRLPFAGVLLPIPSASDTPPHPTRLHTHTNAHTHPNVLDVLMLLEILARSVAPCLPRITPSATALLSNPNENSCYISNSQRRRRLPRYHPLSPVFLFDSEVPNSNSFQRRRKYILKYLRSKRMLLIQQICVLC